MSFVKNDTRRCLVYYFESILEKIISLLSGINVEKSKVYSNALSISDVSWYCDTFGITHQYSCTLYRPISTYNIEVRIKNNIVA